MLEETTDNGATLTRIQYTLGDDVISQTVSTWDGVDTWNAAGTQYLLYDGHGSTRQLADSTGAIVSGQEYSYDGYGVMLSDSTTSGAEAAAAADTKMLYAGEQYDASASMYYNRARYYNQSNGTFNRVDPYSGNTQDPQSLHKYAYCHNNPINNIDPSGMFTQAFGYLAEKAIQMVYSLDHAGDNVSYGRWTRLPGIFRLKPDILNWSKRSWLEIKPLSVSGVADGTVSYAKYVLDSPITTVQRMGY